MFKTFFSASALTMISLISFTAQTVIFPIPEETVKQHFYNDELAEELQNKVNLAEEKLDTIHEKLSRLPGYEKPPAYTHAKYKKSYELEQVREWLEYGWVKTNEFGWPILKEKINDTLPGWLDDFKNQVEETLKKFPDGNVPPDELKKLIDTEEDISDFISVQKHYIVRTNKWDKWCRKGPWLMEDSPPQKLKEEIDILEAYLRGETDSMVILDKLFQGRQPGFECDEEFVKACLEDKKTVYEWYHEYRLQRKKGMDLQLTPEGYVFKLHIDIFGQGARQETADILKNGLERFWKGAVYAVPFKTVADIRILQAEDSPSEQRVQIRIGAENDDEIWPSDTELPYNLDEETAAHEFGHNIGFRDYYRDVYDFEKQTYKTYQWDIFSLMSAQNGPCPIVTHKELAAIVDAYAQNEKSPKKN